MLADIARQPEVLAGLLARRAEFIAAGRRLLAPGPGGRLVVSGCGDGLFAAEAAALFAAEAGLDWRATGALDLVLSAHRLTQRDRAACISMSGNVDRTVEAAQAVASHGVPLLALVNGAGGRLGAIAREKISLDLPDLAPFLCGTASYTATLAALMLLAAGAADAEPMTDALAALPDAVARTSDAAVHAFAGFGADGNTGVRVLAAGADMGTARYGAAKFVELTRIPAWAADLEEFAHSQYWAMPASDLVVIVATGPVVAGYATESCRALADLGVRTLVIDTADAPVETATMRITLPALPETLAPLVAAVPLQHLAYRMAVASGLDPNTRLHLKNDDARFRVSRLLTRRSLIGTGQ
jgi:fructoselysine-6-P-deglycase FrlB-like protein